MMLLEFTHAQFTYEGEWDYVFISYEYEEN